MGKFKAILNKFLIKTTVLETFTIDNVIYKIIDKTSLIPFIKDTRHFCLKKDNRIYTHSSIYLNPKYHFQPIFYIPQKLISVWSDSYSLNSTLILGCAGCAAPRFIGLHYPESKTVGVEISEDFIRIAKKYFLLDQIEKQFDLVQGDAIDYVKNYNLNRKQDIVYVDIFSDNKIISDVFTESFVDALYNCTADNSLVIINILGENIDEVKAFFGKQTIPFNNFFAAKKGNAEFLILTKTNVPQKGKEFVNKLKLLDDIIFF